MKTFKVILLSFILLSSCCLSSSGFAQNNKVVKTSEVSIKVNFNTAAGKTLLEKELKKEPGIYNVVANLKTRTVTVRFNGTQTNRDQINLAIEKIGYTTALTTDTKKTNKTCTQDVGKQTGTTEK